MTAHPHQDGGSVARVWDLYADSYDSSRQQDPFYLSCIDEVVSTVPRGTQLCLDAGCGTGLATLALQPYCDAVVAVDYSHDSLRILDEKVKRHGIPNVTTVQADLQELPFPDSLFDATVCANTLQHLRPNGPQARAVAELRRVTKPNGLICISVHHYSRGKRKAGWIKEGKPGQAEIDYIFRFSREEIEALMPAAAIRAVGYVGVQKIPLLGGRLQRPLAALLGGVASRLDCGHMLVAVERNRK